MDTGQPLVSDTQIILAHEFTELLDQPWQIANFIPSLAVGAVRQTVCEFTVPAQQLGICRLIGLGLTTYADFGRVQWQLVVNGSPVSGYDNIRGQIGNITFPQALTIPLYRGSKIAVLASNLSGSPVLFPTARIGGHTFQALVLAGGTPPGPAPVLGR